MSDEDKHEPGREIISQEDWQKLSSEEQERFLFRVEGFQSPLLPPEVLKSYGDVIPGLDKKLVEWSESETLHRRQLERDAFEEARDLRSRSSIFGPAVSIIGLLVAGGVGAVGTTWSSAFVAMVIAIVAVGGPFAARILAGRFNNRQTDDQVE